MSEENIVNTNIEESDKPKKSARKKSTVKADSKDEFLTKFSKSLKVVLGIYFTDELNIFFFINIIIF